MPYRVGHPAYTGVNRLAFASTKTNAEALLRDRGLTRDNARKLLASADAGSHVTSEVPGGVVEVVVLDTIPYEGERPRANVALEVQLPPAK